MTHTNTTNSARAGRGSRLFRDSRGASAVAFTLAAPVALLGIAGAINYLSALEYQQQVQLAADSAALATAQAFNQNPQLTPTQLQQLGQNYFQANAPSGAPSTGLTVYAGQANGASTIEIDFNGTTKALFSYGAAGGSLPFSTHSQAHVNAGTSSNGPNNGGKSTSGTNNANCSLFYGCFTISGEFTTLPWAPLVQGSGGSNTVSIKLPNNNSCVPGNWYNLLSDAGIEVNASCVADPYLSSEKTFNSFSILLNLNGVKHVVSFNVPPPNYPSTPSVYPAAPNFTFNASTGWYGGITIDGTFQAPPTGCTPTTGQTSTPGSTACWPTYLDGAVSVNVQNSTDLYTGANDVYISYPGYLLFFSVNDLGVVSISYGTEGTSGAEGAAGGIIGQTGAGLTDPNFADFVVNGPTATTYQYYWRYPSGSSAQGAEEKAGLALLNDTAAYITTGGSFYVAAGPLVYNPKTYSYSQTPAQTLTINPIY